MSIFNSIKQQLRILDVIGEHITLKRSGNYFKGCCPFHHEKTASFTVSPDKEIFYCFGCHTGGDAISFTARIENCTQLEAAKMLVERYQLTVPEDDAHTFNSAKPDEKRKYFTICQLVAQWCQTNLQNYPAVRRYLFNRGIDNQCVSYFNLGYFPSGQAAVRSLLSFMAQHQILAEDLLQANIISQGKAVLYSPFEERIIFPIKDNMGHFCGFGGRIYRNDDTRAKYYNSRENTYFTKGNLLYGLDMAKESMQKEGLVFLVEGYTDCIAMAQHGYKNTVAVLGTACTPEHLKQLARYVDHVAVLYDGDQAGQQAALRMTELCWQTDLDIKIIPLPQGEDPASCLIKKIDMQNLIHKAQDIFMFSIGTLGTNFAQLPLNQKLQIARKILMIIARLPQSLKKDMLLQHAAQTLKMPYQALKDEITRMQQAPEHSPTHHPAPAHQPKVSEPSELMPQANVAELPKLEKKIFSAILNDIAYVTQYREHITTLLYCLPKPYCTLLQTWLNIVATQPERALHLLLEQASENERAIISSVLMTQDEPITVEDFQHVLAQLHKKYWKLVVNDIKIKLELAKKENNTEGMQQLLADFAALKQSFLQLEQGTLTKRDAS